MILYFIYKDKRKRVQIEESVSNSRKDIEMNMNLDKDIENEKKGVETEFELEENVSDLKKDAANGKWGDFMVDLDAKLDLFIFV